MKISELLVPLQNAVLGRGKTAQNHSPRTGKHHGSLQLHLLLLLLVVVMLVLAPADAVPCHEPASKARNQQPDIFFENVASETLEKKDSKVLFPGALPLRKVAIF